MFGLRRWWCKHAEPAKLLNGPFYVPGPGLCGDEYDQLGICPKCGKTIYRDSHWSSEGKWSTSPFQTPEQLYP